MHRGYIKTWRKVEDSGWLKNHKLWAFWSWCLIKASHKEIDQRVGMQFVHLMPGDFVFGRKVAADSLAMSEQCIRTCIKSLEKSKNLTIKTTNKFSVISIINWGIYQSEEIQNNQQTNQQLTNKQPTTNQQLTTNKNEKNEKNEKNTDIVEEVIKYLNAKTGKKFSPKTKETKARVLARSREGRTIDDFRRVIDIKCEKWRDDPQMADFLRPETLFGTKFEAYLNEIPVKPTKQIDPPRSAAYSDPFTSCPLCRERVLKEEIKNGKCFECREAKTNGIKELATITT